MRRSPSSPARSCATRSPGEFVVSFLICIERDHGHLVTRSLIVQEEEPEPAFSVFGGLFVPSNPWCSRTHVGTTCPFTLTLFMFYIEY